MQLPVTFRALRYRDFRLFFSGQLISLVGTWMQNVAQSWLVYKLTSSPVLLGLVGFVGQIPVFLLSPAGGIVADRYSRHRVVIATQTVSMILAVILAVLTLTGTVRFWHIMILSALLGMVNAFDIPARQSFITEIVERVDLMNAIALNSAMFNASRIVGPAVAGILVASIGEGWCFFANGVSYIAVIIGLLMMATYPAVKRTGSISPLGDIIEGFTFVIHKAPIHTLLILLGIVSLTGMPFVVLMPIFADRILHAGAEGLGLLMGASGIGALAGALVLATRRSVRGLGRWVAVSTAAFSISLILFGFSRSFWLSLALMLPIGYSMMIQMGSSNTLIQSMAPDDLRGRIMSVYSMMFLGMAPIGALLAGLAADRIGAPITVSMGGVVCLLAAAGFAFRLPAIRVEARQMIVAQQMVAGDPQQMSGAGIAIEPTGDR